MSSTPIRINLDPAAVLYLNKLRLRQRAQIPPQAIELPHFSWSVEKSRLPGMSDKDLTKQMMSGLAAGFRASASSAADSGFVALIRMSSTPKDYSFEAMMPFEQVLQVVTDPKRRAAMQGTPGVDIVHKYGLIDDVRCPVVFMWRSATKDVLITNEFHLGKPEQFLAIDRVGTTSGFLNFLGALNLLQAQDEDAKVYSSLFPQLLKDAMAARADEWLRWFHHCVAERAVTAPKQILVDRNHPETYFYDYSGERV
jgi:hypothetical protein